MQQAEHSRGRLHPSKPKPGLPGTPGLCHTILVLFHIFLGQ
jgi:hypothetical protein